MMMLLLLLIMMMMATAVSIYQEEEKKKRPHVPHYHYRMSKNHMNECIKTKVFFLLFFSTKKTSTTRIRDAASHFITIELV